MIKPVEFLRKDHCIHCDTERSIQCFTVYNKVINYSTLLDRLESGQGIDSIINNAELGYMKCKKCGRVFKIHWNIEKEMPEPMYDDIFYNYFMRLYK